MELQCDRKCKARNGNQSFRRDMNKDQQQHCHEPLDSPSVADTQWSPLFARWPAVVVLADCHCHSKCTTVDTHASWTVSWNCNQCEVWGGIPFFPVRECNSPLLQNTFLPALCENLVLPTTVMRQQSCDVSVTQGLMCHLGTHTNKSLPCVHCQDPSFCHAC